MNCSNLTFLLSSASESTTCSKPCGSKPTRPTCRFSATASTSQTVRCYSTEHSAASVSFAETVSRWHTTKTQNRQRRGCTSSTSCSTRRAFRRFRSSWNIASYRRPKARRCSCLSAAAVRGRAELAWYSERCSARTWRRAALQKSKAPASPAPTWSTSSCA